MYARVNEKHNSPDKTVAYELMDYGEYFIVKAIFEKHMNLPKTDTLYGAIGIDINVDHIALCETNMDGNIVLIKKYTIHKENTKNKRNEELYQLAIEIMEQCKSKKKSLVVEDLNFKQLKTRMLYRPKKQNKTLSSFAYKKILEKLERKCLMNEVDVIKVDPKNTSKIGKEKYTKIKGLSVHYCAAYVIAKRYGVDVTGFNLEYIAQRNECGKKDPQELRDFLNDVRQASYSIRNHIERNFGAKEQEYVTDEFAIGDPVKTPETKDEKASGKEKKAKSQPER